MTHINQNAKRIITQVLCIILACAVVAGGIFGVVKLVEHFNSETKTLNLKFTQGALDSKGEYVETKGSLYTKEAFECQGLSISPAFDNNISYEVFFYDSTGEFLYSSGKQLKNYTFTSSERDIQSMRVSHARIVITPDDDDEIKWNEKSGYVKQLKVEVKRAQEAYTIVEIDYEVETFQNLIIDFEGNQGSASKYYNTRAIDVSGYSKVCILSRYSVGVAFGDENSKNVGKLIVTHDGGTVLDEAVPYYVDIPATAQFLRVGCTDNGYDLQPYQIYLIK